MKLKQLLILTVASLTSAVGVYFAGYLQCRTEYRDNLIAVGYGQYNSKTGQFELTPQDDLATALLLADNVQIKENQKKK